MRRLAVVGAAAAVLVAVLGVVLGPRLLSPTVLPAGGQAVDFFGREATWAQGSMLHHGSRTYDLAPLVVHALQPSRHGIFVEVGDTAGSEAPTPWVRFDGRRSTLPGAGDVY